MNILKKYSSIILLILPISLFFFYKLYSNNHCKDYYYSFNPSRLEIGLYPIDSLWDETVGHPDKYHSWVNKSDKIPRYYTKYIICENWNNSLTKEYDSFLVKIDNETDIISIEYDYNNKKFSYALEYYNDPIKGRFGKLKRVLTKNEVVDILINNGIEYEKE